MKIRAAVLRQSGGSFRIEPLALSGPTAAEVVVRLVACGICHTDLSVRAGVIPVPLPVVLGHEGAGIVHAVGSQVDDLAPGDHVVMTFSSCGTCSTCKEFQPAYCERFGPLNFACTRPDGSTSLVDAMGLPVGSHFFGQSAFATHVAAPRANLIKIDSSLPLHVMAPLGCGVQTGAGAVLNILACTAARSIAVFGVGAVGMSALMAARLAGYATIIAVDRIPHRLELARELGATHSIKPGDGADTAAEIRSILPQGVENVIDTTGSTTVVAAAIRSLGKRGTGVMLGLYRPGDAIPIEARYVVLNGLTIKGVVEGESLPSQFIARLINLYRSGRFPLDRLVTTFDFSDINKAMTSSEVGEVIKPVLLFE